MYKQKRKYLLLLYKAEEVENAHEAGFSCGKYKVFLEIQELDPRITAKEVKNMSMKEMRDLLKELSGTDQEKPEPHEKEKGMESVSKKVKKNLKCMTNPKLSIE